MSKGPEGTVHQSRPDLFGSEEAQRPGLQSTGLQHFEREFSLADPLEIESMKCMPHSCTLDSVSFFRRRELRSPRWPAIKPPPLSPPKPRRADRHSAARDPDSNGSRGEICGAGGSVHPKRPDGLGVENWMVLAGLSTTVLLL